MCQYSKTPDGSISVKSDLDGHHMAQYIPTGDCLPRERLGPMRNEKLPALFAIILYTSIRFSFIRSLNFFNLSVVLTVSMLAGKVAEIDNLFL